MRLLLPLLLTIGAAPAVNGKAVHRGWGQFGFTLADDEAKRFGKERTAAVTACYVEALKQGPCFEGRLSLFFGIDEKGKVIKLDSKSEGFRNDSVVQCVSALARGHVFKMKASPNPSGATAQLDFELHPAKANGLQGKCPAAE